MATETAPTYGTYLKVDELLALQRERSNPPHHDELLFIVIHQVYELWFKQILHEIEAAIRSLDADDALKTSKALRRVHTIQRLLEQQVDVLETMTPQEFNAFRDGLNPASGFQSAQFREIEYVCGLPKAADLHHLAPTSMERISLERRLAEPTLYDHLKALLARHGFVVATPDLMIATFRHIYEHETDHYALYMLLEDFIELDERMLLWRGRHLRMVERMIGMRTGTGGSLGARYLQTTPRQTFFPGTLGGTHAIGHVSAGARDVRQFAAALPQTDEREHMGSASFRVAGKIFAQLTAAETTALIKLPLAEQAACVQAEPDRFSLPVHWSRFGWTYVRLELTTVDELRAMLESSWKAVAPKQLVRAFHSPPPPPQRAHLLHEDAVPEPQSVPHQQRPRRNRR